MNKFYIFLSIFLLTPFCRLSGQTPGEIFNGDFENWDTEVYFEFPATWFTQTDPDLATLTTFKEDDAQDGNYSLKLVTVEYESEAVFGFAVQGNPQQFPPRGIPWSQTIDTLHFWMKSGIENGDAALVWVMLSKDGTVVSNQMEYITESYAGWTHIKFGINEWLVQPDSLFFGIASSMPPDLPGDYTAMPGTWIMVDNVYFTLGNEAQQYPLPNHSFETWNEAVVEDPEGWTSSNIWVIGYGLSMVTKTTDAYSGNYAARLEVIEIDGHTASGRLFYGDGMWDEGGAPFTGQPEYLSFVVKYEPAENDQADLYYVFSNQYGYNMSNYLQISSTGGEFVQYHLPVDLSFQPDSLRIDINSGNNPGSVLIIDKITTEAPVCGPYDVPFREKFDLQPSPHIPACWEATGAGDYYSVSTETYNAYSKPNCLLLSSHPSSLAMLVSPQINADMNQLRIKFFARHLEWVDNKELQIGTLSDPGDPLGFTHIHTLELTPEWQEYRLNLDAYAGTDKYLAFKTGDLSAEDYRRVYLDNITVMFIPLCPEPEDLYTDNITPYTASLHWSEKGTATEWDIIWGPAGFDPELEGILVENITENPCQMTGLDAGTRYQVHVRSHCGTETSDWSMRHVFETECVPMGIPFHENFDAPETSEIPLCWTVSGKDPWDVMVVSWWKYSSAPNSVKFYHSGDGVAILATPEIDVDISTLRLSFYAARYNSYHKLTVGTMTDPQDPDSFTPFKILELTDNMQEYRVYFDGFSGTDRYIAFWYGNYGESGGGEILVDDIMIEYAPLCREPGELFADNISTSSASLHWTEKGAAVTWDILWGEFGFDPETEGTLIEGVSQNPWLLEGLEHSTWYQFQVRSYCNGEKSEWSMPLRFATECQSFDIPYYEDFNNVLTPEIPLCWTATGEGNYSVLSGMWDSYNQTMNFYSSAFDPGISTAMLVTPELNADINKLILKFTARHQWGFTAFHIGTVSDPNDIGSFEPVMTIETGWDNWEEYTVDFSGYEGDHRYIAFMYGNYEAGGGQANINTVDIDLVKFNISASAGENGDIDPEGNIQVRYGFDQAFVVTAGNVYHISELLVDGNVIAGAAGEGTFTYTFENVTEAHSISASFAINTYTISAMVEPEGGGTLTGDGEYEHGQTVSLSAVPSDGFEFVNWTEDSQEVSTDAVFEFTAEADRELVAHFLDVSGVYEHGLMKAEIRVYPNPGNGMFRLDYIALEHGTIGLELINITGQVIYTRKYETTEMISEVIDLKHLGSGVYFLKISEPGKTGIIKLVFK